MSLVISDTSYAGTFASYFWLPATFGMDTIQKGGVYVQDGIKKEHTIGRVDFANPLQPRQATPTSSGTFTVDGRVLSPKDLMAYTEFNPRDYEQHWLAEELSPTLLARELPITAENYMMQIGLDRAFEQIELGLWMGSTSYTAAPGSTGNGQICFFDGFIKKMLNDAAVSQVASPFPLVATASDGSHTNILAAMDSLINLCATNKKALLSRPNRFKRLKFFMSIASEQIYQAASINLTFKGQLVQNGETQPYKGFQIVALAGMPDNTILFVEGLDDVSSNLYVGMNSTEDNNLQLQRLQNNSELFFLKGLMKFDVQYGFSEQVFLYTTLTTSSFNA
ncbi:MAG TPA: hypothetical protein VN722_08500 [Hanamia sp.]|nr:hypothetical protein [Hanamia sp.]